MSGGGQDEQDGQDGMEGEEVPLGFRSTDWGIPFSLSIRSLCSGILFILPSCPLVRASCSSPAKNPAWVAMGGVSTIPERHGLRRPDCGSFY